MDQCVNLSKPQRATMPALVVAMASAGLVTAADLEEAVVGPIGQAQENEYDAPGFCTFLAEMLGTLIASKLLGLGFVLSKLAASDDLIDGGKAPVMAIEVLGRARPFPVMKFSPG